MTDINKQIEEEAREFADELRPEGKMLSSPINQRGYWDHARYGYIKGYSACLHSSRWRKVSEEMPSHEDDLVLVRVKNKNKEDGIWLYDICYIDEGSNTWGKRHHTWDDIIEWKPID